MKTSVMTKSGKSENNQNNNRNNDWIKLQKSFEGAIQVRIPEPGAAEEVPSIKMNKWGLSNLCQLPDLISAVPLQEGMVSSNW
jgi:hypothetical protein